MIIFDIITTIVQAFMMSYLIFFCLKLDDHNDKLSKIKLVVIFFMLIIIGIIFSGSFGTGGWSNIFITHIVSLICIITCYKKRIIEAITAYTMMYFIFQLYSILFGNIIFELVKGFFQINYINYEKICIIYIFQWILAFFCFKYKCKIRNIYKLILFEKFSTSIIIITFFMDFILTFYLLELGKKSQLLKNITDIIFCVFCIAIIFYFGKVHQKSEQIAELNEALVTKNNELRKIKHDYGAQISYLYGLCLMNRFDELKESLKKIINNNESTPSAVEINENSNSLLTLALKPALDNGIHVVVKGDGKIDSSKMPEMELYRVIANIVNNAVRAMNGRGIIIVKLYEKLESLVIKIENNGPKINEEYLQKIFESGFTTKKNNDKNHGFGLSIVKELIESYEGNICVRSSDVSTEFKIVIPVR